MKRRIMKRNTLTLFVFFLITAFGTFRSYGQLKIGDQPTITKKAVALDVQGSNGLQGLWLPRVSDTSSAGIRALNPPDGLIIYHPPSGKLFIRSNNTWVSYLSQAITAITASSQTVSGPSVTFQSGSSTGTANDFNIAANSAANTVTFNMPDASTSARGVVTTGTQTIGGSKTFSNGVTVSGSSGSTSNLTLGITSATTPATVTDRYLSVNSAGIVTLNSVNVIAAKPVTIKNYTLMLNETPGRLPMGSSAIYTFTVPAGTLSTNSTVHVSPILPLEAGTSINWVMVTNSNTISIGISAITGDQKFNPGLGNNSYFNITVEEF